MLAKKATGFEGTAVDQALQSVAKLLAASPSPTSVRGSVVQDGLYTTRSVRNERVLGRRLHSDRNQ